MFDIMLQEEGSVVLKGRLDASQVDKAESVLGSMNESLIADLSGLDYISSAGIGTFVRTYQRLASSGHTLKLINLNPHVKNVFHYAGLEKIFGIE